MQCKERFKPYLDQANQWCQENRTWQWRLALLSWFVYVLVKHLQNPDYSSILSPLNLGIHEFGHLVFGIFGSFFGILGGSLMQLIVPIFGVINFYKQDDFFAIALSFGWLSTNLFDVARYVADAQEMNLPLVSPFCSDTVIHDWNYLLSHLGILGSNMILAFLCKFLAVIAMAICLGLGGWLLWKIKNNPPVLKQ